MAWLTHRLIRALLRMRLRLQHEASHIALGRQGEAEAYFYLKRLGYRIVATNFRAPNDRGEIDIIGWDCGVLCFVEVKTRTNVSFAPPSTAVTRDKQRHILSVAKRYLRHMSSRPPCRFDIVSAVPAAPDGATATHDSKRRVHVGDGEDTKIESAGLLSRLRSSLPMIQCTFTTEHPPNTIDPLELRRQSHSVAWSFGG